ncbi:MAG: hypothetical protein ACLR23_24445 [Clostridia bacterium]
MQIQTFNLWNPGEAIVEDQTSSAYTAPIWWRIFKSRFVERQEERRPAILICQPAAYLLLLP